MTAEFAETLRQLRMQRGLSLRRLAESVHYGKSYLHELETGAKLPSLALAARLDRILDTGGRLAATLRPGPGDEVGAEPATLRPGPSDEVDAEIEAIELARRVSASDVGQSTLDHLGRAGDRMAMAYATTPPAGLLPRVRRHLGYVTSLVGARQTLDQRRQLLIVGGWLSLLRATLHIDLRQAAAADAHLRTAAHLAEQTGNQEIAAWCLETRAWDLLTRGDYRRALDLSRRAQAVAPAGGSAIVQATAQEGRAWARLGDRTETRRALDPGRTPRREPAGAGTSGTPLPVRHGEGPLLCGHHPRVVG